MLCLCAFRAARKAGEPLAEVARKRWSTCCRRRLQQIEAGAGGKAVEIEGEVLGKAQALVVAQALLRQEGAADERLQEAVALARARRVGKVAA
jgi:hypothetical protein